MKSMRKVDRTDGYQPTLNQPWVMSNRPGCIRLDYESGREQFFWYLLMAGFGLLFFGTWGLEPKRYHYRNPLHTDLKLRLLFGTILGAISSLYLRGKRMFLQILAAIVCSIPFYLALQIYMKHGASAIPEEYFFPTFVNIGVFMIALSAMQLFFTDDYLIIDPEKHMVLDHTQYLFIQSERPLCDLDKVSMVQVLERRATSKGVTTVYIKVGIVIGHHQTFTCMHEVSLGKADNLEFGTEAEQVIAMAVAIAGACAKRVHYPAAVVSFRQRQP